MDASDERENDYLRFLRGMRPDDANIQASMPDLTTAQSSELDFRTSFVGPDGLPEIDHDGAEFARMLLAQAEQEQKDTEADEAVAAAQAEAQEAAAAVNGVLQLSTARSARGASVLPRGSTVVVPFISSVSSASTPSVTSLTRGMDTASSMVEARSASMLGATSRCKAMGTARGTAANPCAPLLGVRTRGWKEGTYTSLEGNDRKKTYFNLPLKNRFCKTHGGGRFCQEEGCKRRDIGGGRCISHGGGKKCQAKDCTKVDRGGGFCKAHGGGKKCEADNCNNWALGGGICLEHKGPGKRCKTLGCTKYDLGGGHCIAHGGGRKCVVEGCDKIRQVNKRCRGHGGKVLCSIPNCERAAQNRKLCKAHGGAKLCSFEGCINKQKGKGLCIRHGGGTKCKEDGCDAIERGGGYCKGHGGGKKCSAQVPRTVDAAMLRLGSLLALGAALLGPAATEESPPSPPINYRTYAEMTAFLLQLNASFPDVVQVSVAQETYGLPYPSELQCIVDDGTKATEPCKQFVVHLTNHSTLASDPQRPEVFISGALHGNERVGPNAAIELVALFAHATSSYAKDDNLKPTVDTQRWLRELVNTRNVLVTPMTNAYGYSHNHREELTVDPNRDYNYMRAGAECMQTMTSRVVNEIWRDHIFQLAVTFHDGTRAVAYEWGSPDHYLDGDEKKPSEKSPDHMAQFQISHTLANFAGVFPDGKLYPTGTMNDVVYGVSGGMEDWGYAASWENQFYNENSQPFHPCEPTTFGGYPAEKTVYNNITHRAFNMLVETSDAKEPRAADLGNTKELYKANVDFFRADSIKKKFVGHVPRNVRLALMMIEMVQPLVRWVDASTSKSQDLMSAFPAASLYTTNTEVDQVTEMGCGAHAWELSQVATCSASDCSVNNAAHSKVQVAWEVLGALTVDSTHVQVSSSPKFEDGSILMQTAGQKGTTRRFYEFAPDTSEATVANADTMGTSLFVTCLNLQNATSDKLYVRAVATVDQKQGSGYDSPSPRIPPQSHLVNARTNPEWNFEWNGHQVQGSLHWTSPVITIDVSNKAVTSVSSSKAPTESQKADASPLSPSSQRDKGDSIDPLTIDKERTKEVSSDEGEDESEDDSAESESDDEESEDSGDSQQSDDSSERDDTTLDDEMKAPSDSQGVTPEPSSSITTQDATALAGTGSGLDGDDKPSSLLQFGYLAISSCAMIIVLTLAYLYRRVFRRPRQPYMNISSLEQTTRVTINNFDDEDYDVDDSESEEDDNGQGPRIPRHAQSSRSVFGQYRGLRSCDGAFNALLNMAKDAEDASDTDAAPQKPPQLLYAEYMYCTGNALCQKPLVDWAVCVKSVQTEQRDIKDCALAKRLLERCLHGKTEELLKASQPQVFRPSAAP
ncbi:unnamed protein product [Phytophthora fragariaefolia]|uniref:Unnamed protein product n=1 Tax=Phytophthora fragariaefolia TaxID=1490495 RepID=A0A9W6Y0Y1_9STRA|nr:unnamed protein product [Phytophthora fragariaefolia]